MKAEQLQAIKDRAKYATDGPWKVVKSEDSGVQIGTAWEHGQLKAGVPIVTTGHGKDGVTVYINHVNAEFIAHAREDIPALIAEVESLQELLKGNDGMSVLEIREQFVHLHRQLLKEQEKSNKYREALLQIQNSDAWEIDGAINGRDCWDRCIEIAAKALAGDSNAI